MLARSEAPKLIEAYRALHQQGRFAGYSIGPYIDRIAELVRESGASTMLDYGCGKGLQYSERGWHAAWGFMPTLYDPAVPGLDTKPLMPFDAVVCIDVLEHVPEDEIDAVIAELARLARLLCFVTVCCRPAKKAKCLPDGRNVHVTLKPREWWFEKLAAGSFAERTDLYLAITP